MHVPFVLLFNILQKYFLKKVAYFEKCITVYNFGTLMFVIFVLLLTYQLVHFLFCHY
jgi:hypothetical protein